MRKVVLGIARLDRRLNKRNDMLMLVTVTP